MKKLILSAVLAVGLAASAHAQYVDGDLILGFRTTGAGSTVNLQVDLGNLTAFQAYAPGGTLLTNLTGFGSNSISDASVFGASWNRSDVLWGAVGTLNSVDNTLIASEAAASSLLNGLATTQNTTGGYGRSSSGGLATASARITSLSTTQTSTVNVVPTTNSNSWQVLEQIPPAVSFKRWTPGLFENNTSALNLSNASSYVASDLWLIAPGTAGAPSTFLGTLALFGNGNVEFFAAAIPEPSTYAMILGVAALGFVMIRRRQQSLA